MSRPQTALLSAAKADHAWNQGEPGFYVVNHKTQIAVAGPFRFERDAHTAKAVSDVEWEGADADVLRVCEVSS